MRHALLIFVLLLVGCGEARRAGNAAGEDRAAQSVGNGNPAAPDVLPPAAKPVPPGQPGGLPDDRTPVSEAPFSETSEQGAANVVQTYYALVEQGGFGEARLLWSDPSQEDSFAQNLESYGDYHAQIGAPGRMEGAAGSSYVDVPIQAYGRLKTGRAFEAPGVVTLRRVNDVPGSTAEQRKWHIVKIVMLPQASRGGSPTGASRNEVSRRRPGL